MRKILIVILWGLSGCTSDKRATTNEDGAQANITTDNEFLKFVSILPKLNLPYETNCNKCCEHPDLNYDDVLIKKFKPEGSAIVGLVNRTGERVVILVTYSADMLVPSIKVYDLEGKLTDQMDFMTGYCGGDPEYYGKQYFKINPDLSLIDIDTSYYLTRDSTGYHVTDTTKIEVTKRDYFIDDKGRIEENNAR